MAEKRIRQLDLDMYRENNKKNKRKGIIVAVVSVLGATGIAASSILSGIFTSKNKNKTEYEHPKNTIVNNVDDNEIQTSSLDSLGVELEFPKGEKKEYGNPSGNINVNDIVEDKNGTLWVNQEAESKKNEIGKKVTDTKGGTLEVKPNGDVYEKETSYQIVDKNGNVKEEGKVGSNGLPSGFEYDKDTGKIRDSEHANTGLYIAPDGTTWASKDEYLKSLEGEKIIDTETKFIPMDPVVVEKSSSSVTSKPSNTTSGSTNEVTEPSKPTETTKPSNSGTYYDEISGLTFQSKEHYQQWVLQDFEGYGIINGIMVPKTDEMVKADEKVLTK